MLWSLHLFIPINALKETAHRGSRLQRLKQWIEKYQFNDFQWIMHLYSHVPTLFLALKGFFLKGRALSNLTVSQVNKRHRCNI